MDAATVNLALIIIVVALIVGAAFAIPRLSNSERHSTAPSALAAVELPGPDYPRFVAHQAYRTLVVIDIEQFSRGELDDRIRVRLRRAVRDIVATTLEGGGVPPGAWSVASDTGDGLLLVIDPTISTAQVVRAFMDLLPGELGEHNRITEPFARFRLRAVAHAAHVMVDEYGTAGEQVNLVFRLLDSEALRSWLRAAGQSAAIAVSNDVYQQVVRQRILALDPECFHGLCVQTRDGDAVVWVQTGCPGRGIPSRVPGRPGSGEFGA